MVLLFQQLKELMLESVKELAMVITSARRTVAVSIDSAVGVGRVAPEMIKEVRTEIACCQRELIRRAVQRGTGSLALVLEPDLFVF